MTAESSSTPPPARLALHILARKNVLAGLMFIVIAALGLWVSRDYPIGTALRMGTGYVPRLLCWILMGLGAAILVLRYLPHVAAHEGALHGPIVGNAVPAFDDLRA